VKIQKNNVKRLTLHGRECIFGAGCDLRIMAIESQNHFHGLPNYRLVVHDQDTSGLICTHHFHIGPTIEAL
jgi:hypothetical protein